MTDDTGPQLEDGYTQIANELLEALVAYETDSPALLRFVLAIIRETYGWKKKWRAISTQRLARIMNVSPRRLRRIRQKAVALNLIEYKPGTAGRSPQMPAYSMQKRYSEWLSAEHPYTGTPLAREKVSTAEPPYSAEGPVLARESTPFIGGTPLAREEDAAFAEHPYSAEETGWHPETASQQPEQADYGEVAAEMIDGVSRNNGVPPKEDLFAEQRASALARTKERRQRRTTKEKDTHSLKESDDLRQRLCDDLLEIGVRPTAKAEQIAADCYEDDLGRAAAWARYILAHPDHADNPGAYVVTAITDDYPLPTEKQSAETGITQAQAQGNAFFAEMDRLREAGLLPQQIHVDELGEELPEAEPEVAPAPSALQQAVHNVQTLVDEGLDLEVALYRLSNLAGQPWSAEFKQQVRGQITELPETAKPGPIPRESGSPGGTDTMIEGIE